MKLDDHPTVQRIRSKTVDSIPPKKEPLDAGWLKQLVLDAGADDARKRGQNDFPKIVLTPLFLLAFVL